jgi:hypothetical protein
MDRLFDSVNGSTVHPQGGKELRCAVQRNSRHFPFWLDAKEVLRSMKFQVPDRQPQAPSLVNWIRFLDNFSHLSKGFQYVMPRNFNQDPLENFFSKIRAHGVRNINPTATSFNNSFRSIMMTNFAGPHSPGANCEADGDLRALIRCKSMNGEAVVNSCIYDKY